MFSEDEDMECDDSPDTSAEGNKAASTHVVPAMSKRKYDNVYNDFQRWNKLKGATPVTQSVLLKYFKELAKKSKPNTLWTYYSMMKATLRSNDNIDIGSWSMLLDFLKRNYAGFKPNKPKLFTDEEIEKFINEAPDEQWLYVKVVCIFGLNGTHSSAKLVNIKVEHIKQYEEMFWVIIPNAETKYSFTITGTFYSIVQKYAALRPKNTTDNRFFLQYHEGKCTDQPVGKNQFTKIPRKIAKYLNLPEPDRYLGTSFRLSSLNEFLVRHSNRKILTSMPNTDAFNSTSVPERHAQDIDQDLDQDIDKDLDQVIEYSLDCETGLLKTSPVKCKTPSLPAVSSKNDNTTDEHVCTASCNQVKCAKEDNEKNALHAFSIMKPSDYAITEVIPAQFASDTTCRWMVAYSHLVEPVSSYNADEKFEEITRSIPNNATVVEKYVRGNSSQLFAAYVVVYGVKCRCLKPVYDPFSAQPPDVFKKRNFDPLSTQTSDVLRKEIFDPLSGQPSNELTFSMNDIKHEVY